ncbi:MAG: urease accessory protein, partial [Actinomycetota bacterium]|nr:urease accessory protein [Actinomycetota bacterium]
MTMTRAGRSGSAAGGLPTAALLLADGRFPSGGHAHSLGLEAAVADGRVRDLDTLGAFAAGRLATAGLCDAA